MEKVNVELSDIFEYIASSRPIKEGEAVFKAGHVLLCGIKEGSEPFTIVSSCLQTSHLSADPHMIEVILKPEVQDWSAKCSCKAGLGGKCKHIVAVLLHVNRSEELEKVSCTDLEQAWGKIGSKSKNEKQYSLAMPVSEFCHPTLKKEKLTPVGDVNSVLQDNLEILKKCDTQNALQKFKHGRTTLEKTLRLEEALDNPEHKSTFQFVKSFLDLENEVLSKISQIMENQKTDFFINEIENVDVEATFLQTMGQNSEFWQKCRKYRITGSSCYNLFTYTKNKNPDWDSKLNRFFNPTFSGNAATEYGKQEEKHARELYSTISNQKVKECGFVINPKTPWLGFSPDGITDQGFLIEIKCPLGGKVKPIDEVLPQLNYLNCEDGEYYLKQNHIYYGQVQLGMSLLNFEYTDFIIYSSFNKSLHIIKVKKDINFCINMIETLKWVYFEKMLMHLSTINI